MPRLAPRRWPGRLPPRAPAGRRPVIATSRRGDGTERRRGNRRRRGSSNRDSMPTRTTGSRGMRPGRPRRRRGRARNARRTGSRGPRCTPRPALSPGGAPREDHSPAPAGSGHDGGTARGRRWSRSVRARTERAFLRVGAASRLRPPASRGPGRAALPGTCGRRRSRRGRRARPGRRRRVARHPFCLAACRQPSSRTGCARDAMIVLEDGMGAPRRVATQVATQRRLRSTRRGASG